MLGLCYEISLPIDLAVDHLLHFLKPAKFMLHLSNLGHSQRSPFLLAARQIGQPVKESVGVLEFVFQ